VEAAVSRRELQSMRELKIVDDDLLNEAMVGLDAGRTEETIVHPRDGLHSIRDRLDPRQWPRTERVCTSTTA
jgi:hypothetical protein